MKPLAYLLVLGVLAYGAAHLVQTSRDRYQATAERQAELLTATGVLAAALRRVPRAEVVAAFAAAGLEPFPNAHGRFISFGPFEARFDGDGALESLSGGKKLGARPEEDFRLVAGTLSAALQGARRERLLSVLADSGVDHQMSTDGRVGFASLVATLDAHGGVRDAAVATR